MRLPGHLLVLEGVSDHLECLALPFLIGLILVWYFTDAAPLRGGEDRPAKAFISDPTSLGDW